jgi:hypothetical protein
MVLFLIVLFNSLSPREKVRVRGSNKQQMLYPYPLILSFSRSTQRTSIKEKGRSF